MGRLFAPGLAAVRANLVPFLGIQTAAAMLVLAYFLIPSVAPAVEGIGRFKQAGGYLSSGLFTILAGFVLPETVKRLSGRPGTKGPMVAFQIGFFFVIGIWIDVLYRLLAMAFGPGNDPLTVFYKVCVDQFVQTPLVTIPFGVLAFLWAEEGFSGRRFFAAVRRPGEVRSRWATLLVTAWAFWLPVLVLIFALPVNLQFPMFVLVQAAWSLILVHVSTPALAPA